MIVERHVLETPRLRLEPTRVHHAKVVYDKVQDERLWTFFPHLRPKTLDELQALYRRWQRGNPYADRDEEWENWTCFRLTDDAPVGSMQATILPQGHAMIAYIFYVEEHGKGYAREASQAVIEHLRAEHAVVRVTAEMNTENARSIRLAESLGFVRVDEHIVVDRVHGNANEYLYELMLE